MPSNGKLIPRSLLVLLIVVLPLVVASTKTAKADQTLVRSETLELNVGDSVVIHSNHLSIQQVFLDGNLTAATIAKPAQYPTNDFQLTSSAPGTYELRIIFNQSTDYSVDLFVRQNGTNAIDNSTSYYVSGGSFELDVTAYYNPQPAQPVIQTSSTRARDNFGGWVGSFGQAFPLWVKVLYLILGAQFMMVGGLWIKRESARKEEATQPLDWGEKAFLWLDVLYKFLIVSFVAIVAIMGGELILLFVLRFMFLVSLELLSLWDLFVVGFALGAVIIVYLIRIILEKGFDLKPFEMD